MDKTDDPFVKTIIEIGNLIVHPNQHPKATFVLIVGTTLLITLLK